MNLEKMLEAQKVLDDRIIKAKGLEGQGLFPNTVLALQVELAEFAQEGRWFKHWSDDQEPRTWRPNEKDICESCNGNPIFIENGKIVGQCENCDGCGVHFYNPLLEEFADGVHFFLSIANQKGWQDALYIYEDAIEETREEGFDGGLTGIFLEMLYFLNKCYFENPKKEDDEKFLKLFGFPQEQYWFRLAWSLFITIGLVGFDFTPEQIEEAYFAKNQINHSRQESGVY